MSAGDFTPDVAFVHAYDRNLHVLAQEDAPEWMSAVTQKPGVKGKSYNIDRLQGVEAVPITGRHSTTEMTPYTHSRRRLTFADYGLSEMLDDEDEARMIINPTSAFASGFAKAFNRKTARTITTAMLGNAVAVDNADALSNVALPSTQQIANGSTNMTMAKLRQAVRMLDEMGMPASGRYIAVSPRGVEKLMSDSQVTSSDYSTLQAIMHGTIPAGTTFFGFTWIKPTDALGAGTIMSDPILPKSGNVRSCIAWWKGAVAFASIQGFNTTMGRDLTHWNNLRVISKFSQGAVRVEDEGVVQIDIDETA